MPAALPIVDASGALCCAPLGSADFAPGTDADAVAARLRALADANRLRIVQELSCCEGHELTTSATAQLLSVSEPTASHHLRQLREAGLLTSRRDGPRVLYRLNLAAVRAIATTLAVSCGASCACH